MPTSRSPEPARRRPGLLFLCVANRARSQMAEGIARHLAGGRLEVQSAGSRPSSVHPLAVAVLCEIGIDISAQRSKPVAEIGPGGLRWVITLCAEEECPFIPAGAERLHWPLPDPDRPGSAEEQLRAFRDVRDTLQMRIAAWLASVLEEGGTALDADAAH